MQSRCITTAKHFDWILKIPRIRSNLQPCLKNDIVIVKRAKAIIRRATFNRSTLFNSKIGLSGRIYLTFCFLQIN